MQCRVGELPGHYLRADPNITPKERNKRLQDMEGELRNPHCPYRNLITRAELGLTLGFLACNPAYRWSLGDLLSDTPPHIYMKRGPRLDLQ